MSTGAQLQILPWLFAAGCAIGTPFGWSAGEQWSFPLVGPLEDGLLMTPVRVDGHGPYLFVIDPDSTISAVDVDVAVDAQLRIGTGPHRIDESDTGRTWFYADLHNLQIADLTIDRRDVNVFPNRRYNAEGRRIHGVLGRDVIADSMVFGFDRDRGIATLSTVRAFHPPPEAFAIKFEWESAASSSHPGISNPNMDDRTHAAGRPGGLADVTPAPRRLARTQIGDLQPLMHLDLGAVPSQLPESQWRAARLVPSTVKLRLVDEAASVRRVVRAGTEATVMLGGAKVDHIAFVPFVDSRWRYNGTGGTLGLDFFRPFSVYANWHKTTYYLQPRSDTAELTSLRIARWGNELPSCPHTGCITMQQGMHGQTAALRVVRDPEAINRPLEVFLAATSAAGRSLEPLVIELPAGADHLLAPIPRDYVDATLVVLDVSPFPRDCVGDRGCLALIGGEIIGGLEVDPMADAVASVAAPAPHEPKHVPLQKLHRRSGDPAIPPNDAPPGTAARPPAAALVKICIAPDGKIDSTKIVKSSGVAAYDEQLQNTIAATWSFEPIEIDGHPATVCTSAVFLAR